MYRYENERVAGDMGFGLKRKNLPITIRLKSLETFSGVFALHGLRDRVSEREKLRITATYFAATGEMEKYTQTYELWTANYPRDFVPHNALGTTYISIGQFEKALAEYQESLRLEPDNVLGYANLGFTYIGLNRLDEAKAAFDQALAHKLDDGRLRVSMYLLAFLRGIPLRWNSRWLGVRARPGAEDWLLSVQSDTEAYYGRLSKARDFSRRAVDSALRAESKEKAASRQVYAAVREAELGNTAPAKQGVTAALALSLGWYVKVAAARSLISPLHPPVRRPRLAAPVVRLARQLA